MVRRASPEVAALLLERLRLSEPLPGSAAVVSVDLYTFWRCRLCNVATRAVEWPPFRNVGDRVVIRCPSCERDVGRASLAGSSAFDSGEDEVPTPPFTGTRESLHARIADVLRRSGVSDAEQLIRGLEIDRGEIEACLNNGRLVIVNATYYPNSADLREIHDRIDACLSGRSIGPPATKPSEIGPAKPASEASE